MNDDDIGRIETQRHKAGGVQMTGFDLGDPLADPDDLAPFRPDTLRQPRGEAGQRRAIGCLGGIGFVQRAAFQPAIKRVIDLGYAKRNAACGLGHIGRGRRQRLDPAPQSGQRIAHGST